MSSFHEYVQHRQGHLVAETTEIKVCVDKLRELQSKIDESFHFLTSRTYFDGKILDELFRNMDSSLAKLTKYVYEESLRRSEMPAGSMSITKRPDRPYSPGFEPDEPRDTRPLDKPEFELDGPTVLPRRGTLRLEPDEPPAPRPKPTAPVTLLPDEIPPTAKPRPKPPAPAATPPAKKNWWDAMGAINKPKS